MTEAHCLAHRAARALALPLAIFGLVAEAPAQLLHRYSFDGAGVVALDSTSGASGDILGGAALNGTGAVLLDGLDDYVELPSNLIAGLTDATIEVWASWGGATSWQRIFDFGDNTGGVGGQGVGITYFVLAARDNVQLVPTAAMRTAAIATSVKVYANSLPPSGALTHYAVVYDATNDAIRLYMDGVLQNTLVTALELTALNGVNCYLGRSQFTQDAYFNGAIDELRVYAGARSAAEIAASFAAGPDVAVAGVSYCAPGATNSTGSPGRLVAAGTSSAGLNALTLRASDLPANSFGFFLTSQSTGFVMGPGGSQGNLCLGSAIGRYVGPGQIKNSGAAGAFELALDLTQTPQPTGLVSVQPGQIWHFQCWHRDAVGGSATSNFTDAMTVAFE